MRRPWRKPLIAPARGRWVAGAAVLGLAWLTIGTPSSASTAVPYKDPNAVGSIGLCDAHGHQVTSGSVNTAPFAWRAVSTSPATGSYAGPTRTAVLMAYQPIQGLAPPDWSGDSLTAASRYSNPSNPMAAATGGDESLAGFMTEYSPKWDGILQLRLYLDAANEPVYSLHYPALDIQVKGNTWHALDGGPVDCNAGTVESIESILLPASTLKTPPGSSTKTDERSERDRRLHDHNPEPDDECCRECRRRHHTRGGGAGQLRSQHPELRSFGRVGRRSSHRRPGARRRRPAALERPPQARRPRAGYVRTNRRPGRRSRRSPIHERFDSVNTPPRRLARQAGLTLFASLLLLGGSVLSSVSWLGAAPAGASSAPPWEPDPDSVGGLVFYNSSGQVVTGGSITDSPIAAYVQGSSTVRTGDTVATLYGYLPVNGQPTSEWSGEQLGLTTIFPNPSAPAPLNTSPLPLETGNSGDETLQTLEADFPNNDHSGDGYAGMYQLRLYTNAPHKTQTTVYDSADILISGSTWSVVYPASATPTTTTLTASPAGPQQFGTNETLTATISPSAAPGTVQFEVNGTDIGNPVTVSGGTAQKQTSTLPVGADNLSAVFTPTTGSGFAASTGTASFTVNPVKTTTSLSVSPASPQPAGTPETLTATVSPSAAPGTVQFEDNGNNIGSPVTVSGGTAQTQTSSLPSGTNNLSAVFTPSSGDYAGSTGTASFTITAAPTTTTLTVSPASPQQFGTNETLTATISPSAATGTVQFEDNGSDIGSPVTVSAGTAHTQTSTLPVGTDALKADFTPTNGNGFSPSSDTTSFTVNPITTTTALAASPASPQFAGTPETLTATISPSAAPGTVQFEVNGTDIGSPVTVSGGTAHTQTSTLPVGTDSLKRGLHPVARATTPDRPAPRRSR